MTASTTPLSSASPTTARPVNAAPISAAPAAPVGDASTPSLTAAASASSGGATNTASDGRTVAVDPATVVASGGDTPIGRILARATLANAAASTTTESTSTAAASATAGDETATASSATTASATTSVTTGAATTAAKTLDAFVQAFGAALARDDATSTKVTTATTTAPAVASTTTQAAFDPTGLVGTSATTHSDATAILPPAPASTLPQAQTVDPNAVVDQVLQGVSLRTTDGSSEVRLRLVPDSLGDVSIKLVVTGGSVTASLTASTPDAQNALMGGQAQLARTLADAGLKLQSFTVALGTGAGSSGTGNGGNGSGTDARSRQASTRRVGAIDATGDDTDDPSLLAVPTIGPSIYTPSTVLGSMNYLV